MYIYKPSQRLLDIFYADLFDINNQGVLLLGAGKTSIGRLATSNNPASEISTDYVCLSNDEGILRGHWEAPISDEGFVPTKKVGISQCHYLLDFESTKKLCRSLDVVEVEVDEYVRLADFDLTFRFDNYITKSCLMSEINDKQRRHFLDPKARVERFQSFLTSGAGLKCYVVPWQDSVEMKSDLIRGITEERKKEVADATP